MFIYNIYTSIHNNKLVYFIYIIISKTLNIWVSRTCFFFWAGDLCWPCTPGLRVSSCLTLFRSWEYRTMLMHMALNTLFSFFPLFSKFTSILHVYECFACIHINAQYAWLVPKKDIRPLELELQFYATICFLGTEPGSSAKAAHALSPVLSIYFF